MAGIDKIYGTQKQHWNFERWLEKHCFKIMLFTRVFFWESTNPIPNIYDRPEGVHPNKKCTITNFSTPIDIYLMLFCKIPFVRKRLKEQYGNASIISIRYNEIKTSIKYWYIDFKAKYL